MIGITNVVQITVISLTSASSLVGNTLLILACLNKSSGKLNIFLIHLCTADLLLTGYTPLLFYIMAKGPAVTLQTGNLLCYISNNHIIIASTLNCTTILLIAYERFVAIKDPLRYHTIMNKRRMLKMVACCWVTVILATLVKGAIVKEFSTGPRFNTLKGFCVDDGYDVIAIKIGVEVFMSGFLLVVPLIITTALYCSILIKIYKSGKRFRSLRSVKSVDKTYDKEHAENKNGDLIQNTKPLQTQQSKQLQLEMREREDVVAELRDLTKDVDVESISETVMKCRDSGSNLNELTTITEKTRPVSRKVLRKQKTAIEMEILGGDAFNEIIRNLKKFKEQYDNTGSYTNRDLHNDRPRQRFTKSVHHKASRKSQSVCNLRKFRSVESFEDMRTSSASEKHYSCSNPPPLDSILKTSSLQRVTTSTSNEDGVATSCFPDHSKLGLSRDDLMTGNGVELEGGIPDMEKSIMKKSTRRGSRDNLLGKTATSKSIKDKLHGRKQHSVKLMLEDELAPRKQTPEKTTPNSDEVISPDPRHTKRRLTFQAVAKATMWSQDALNGGRINQDKITESGRRESVLRSKSLDDTLGKKDAGEERTGVETQGSTDLNLNWRMLILMMRLAKLARQPTAVIQERLGTTKYQIQLVKAAVMSCVAFYVLTLPFIIITVLPGAESQREPILPIIILPLINCIADFLVYGIMHPTIRSQVHHLLHKPRYLNKTCSPC